MLFRQSVIHLRPRPRGFHLVTNEILLGLPDFNDLTAGLLSLFLQHTSASLFLNENADADVRADFERWARHAVPDGAPIFIHTAEGDDDMPAHIKAALFGVSLVIPIRDGKPALGAWQGIYLGEHRDQAGPRSLIATAWGSSG